MNADATSRDVMIDDAVRALEEGERARASQLYEKAAEAYQQLDRYIAGHLLLLAAQYAEPDGTRAIKLTRKAQQAYESEGDHRKASQAALLQAKAAEGEGAGAEARQQYMISLDHAAEYVAQRTKAAVADRDVKGLVSDLEAMVELMSYCCDRLGALDRRGGGQQ